LAVARQQGEPIGGIRLAGCAGILSWPTQPGRSFASELAGRVRVIACLQSDLTLLCTDATPANGLVEPDMARVRHALGLNERDAGVVVWGPAADVATALDEVRARVCEACDGVPSETRQHLDGGLTDFERLLPGPDRMYPDTDHPPVRLQPQRVEHIRRALPEPTRVIEQRFARWGLPADVVPRLALSRHVSLIDALGSAGHDMKLAGRLLGQTARSLEREGVDLRGLGDEQWWGLVRACEQQCVPAKLFARLVRALADDPRAEPSRTVAKLSAGVCRFTP
jgi:glutamyl-tRNA(Gln) amidotransferase subunit E